MSSIAYLIEQKRATISSVFRYTTFLEEQQSWLIHGIRELYRHLQTGDGWPGEPLHCEANGKPLVHDMLSRLGSLDQPGIKSLHECGHDTSDQNPPHRQNLYDKHQNTPDTHPSKVTPENFTSVQALPIDLSNTLLSPMPHLAQDIELDGNHSSSFTNTTHNVSGTDSVHDSPRTHSSGNLGQCNEPYTNLFDFESASHDEPSCNEVQISSPILECPTEIDSVGSDLFAGIAIHPADWDAFLNPSIQGQLSTDGYWTPFYDTQAMPFEYAASA